MTQFPEAILQTFLTPLIPFLLSAHQGHEPSARASALLMLNAYNCTTPEELSLAAEVISFRLHSLAALSQASDPDLAPNKIIRLRGSAVSLAREAHKAERRLDHLKRASQKPAEQPQAQAQAAIAPQPQPQPKAEQPAPPLNQKLLMAQRIAEIGRRNAEKHAATIAGTPQAA